MFTPQALALSIALVCAGCAQVTMQHAIATAAVVAQEACTTAGLGGVTVTGTPALRQIVIATSSTTAEWGTGGGAAVSILTDLATIVTLP